jgi:hypothetical protein
MKSIASTSFRLSTAAAKSADEALVDLDAVDGKLLENS